MFLVPKEPLFTTIVGNWSRSPIFGTLVHLTLVGKIEGFLQYLTMTYFHHSFLAGQH